LEKGWKTNLREEERNMRAVAVALVLVMLASSAFAIDNSRGQLGHKPHSERVPGLRVMSVVAYTDDYQGYDYIVDALNQLGMGYDLYMSDPDGFEVAVQTGNYDLILVNHENYFTVSNAWDDIAAELAAGKKAIVSTFDCDGSDDYSGGMDDILGFAGHEWNYDVQTAGDMYGWDHFWGPLWTGMPNPCVPVMPDAYFDEGDGIFGYADNSFAGWTPAFSDGDIAMNTFCCSIIVACWVADEYSPECAIQWWKNSILFLTEGPTVTARTTWGSVKALYE
jgi:hypothetical protein